MQYTDIGNFDRRLLAARFFYLKSRYGVEQLDPLWLASNGQGKANFCVWLEGLYCDLPQNLKRSLFCLKRRDDSLPWLEDNCHLVLLKDVFADSPRQVINKETTDKIIQYAKNKPTAPLMELANLYMISVTSVSIILRRAGIKRVRKNTK